MSLDFTALFGRPDEKPLESVPSDGGFCGIFRTIACVGDSLSSGEFETVDAEGHTAYLDCFEYSWGQVLARMAGCKVYNFSRGGMTAQAYCEGYAANNGYFDADKAAQAYILALGLNDLHGINRDHTLGTTADIDLADWRNNTRSFAGFYGQIIQRYKEIQPKARFFLLTIPHESGVSKERDAADDAHAALLHQLAALFPFTYVMDIRRYAPVYDDEFKKQFYLFGHMNPAGYLYTGRMVVSYMDYIIRHNMSDFKQAGLIGTPHYMEYLDQD